MFHNEWAAPFKGAIILSNLNCFVNSFIQGNHRDVCHTFFLFFSQLTTWFVFNFAQNEESFPERRHTSFYTNTHEIHAYTETCSHYWGCQRKDTDLDGCSVHLGMHCLAQRHLSPSSSPPSLLLSNVSLLKHMHYRSNAPVSHHLYFHRGISRL